MQIEGGKMRESLFLALESIYGARGLLSDDKRMIYRTVAILRRMLGDPVYWEDDVLTPDEIGKIKEATDEQTA